MKELDRATYRLKLSGKPKRFTLHNSQGELYYIRELDGNTDEISINICHHDRYTPSIPFTVLEREELTPYGWDKIELPEPERNKVKQFRIKYNPNLKGTPARIFTDSGLIEIGERFYKYPPPLRMFILFHEFGHFYYITESLADLYALKMYLMLGYNESNAFYALSKILHPNEQNNERITKLFETIKNTKL